VCPSVQYSSIRQRVLLRLALAAAIWSAVDWHYHTECNEKRTTSLTSSRHIEGTGSKLAAVCLSGIIINRIGLSAFVQLFTRIRLHEAFRPTHPPIKLVIPSRVGAASSGKGSVAIRYEKNSKLGMNSHDSNLRPVTRQLACRPYLFDAVFK